MGPPPASAPRTDSSPAPWEPPAPDAPPRTFGPDPRAEPRRTTTREWDAWLPTPRRGARVAPDAEARRDDPADEVRDEEPVQDPTGWPDPRPVAGVDPATTSTWGPPPAPPGPPPAPNPRAGGARRTRRLWDEPTEPAAPRGPVPAPRIGGPTPDPDRAAPQDPDAPTAPTGAVIRDTPAAPAPTTDPADSPVPDDEHPAQSAAHRDEPQPPWTTLRPWEPPATTPANTSHRPPPRPRTETRDETRAENRTETGDETWAGSRAQAGDETWAGSQAQASDETWTGSRAQAGDETWTENRDEPRAETGSETGSETRDEPRAEAPRRDLPPLPTSFPAWDDGLAEEPPTTPPPAPPRDAAPTPLEQLLPRAAAAPPPGQPHLPRDPAPLEQPRLPRAAAPPPPDPADPPHEAPPPERTAPPPPSRTPTAEWDAPTAPPAPLASAAPPVSPAPRPATAHIGDGPPTYDPEPTALVTADPNNLDALVPDTVLDGARYGSYTLRAGSVRGDSARYRGEPRRDALLVARFGDGVNGLVLVAVAGGARASECAHLAAADACDWIAGAVGRSHSRLAEDIRAGRRGDLKSGLHRLTDRSFGKLRARAAELGLEPGEYTADLRCLLLPADPDCRTRIFFGVGEGGLLRLRDGVWQDIEPPEPRPDALTGAPVVGFGAVPTNLGAVPTNLGAVPTNPEETASDVTQQDDPEQTPQGDRLTMDLGITTGPAPHVDLVPPSSLFRFRASVARPGDTLLLCSAGLAEPLRGEPALAGELAARWEGPDVPGLAGYLADMSLRVKGYADDRTAVAVWET
ncbi:protein phosphatase 2C domain-containing protein [Streptomyces sp. NPDC051561]|uniref:protein phosphatase 2C domain-containing protein n=1 Tax=Streptomyces sp. NPDC051561 TaxID=3365658 RepID=UPI0037B1C6C7